MGIENIKITTVYDNNKFNPKIDTDCGFSCVIEHPNGKIIFDSGAKPEILENNLKKLDIDPTSIDYLIISLNIGIIKVTPCGFWSKIHKL
jgi:7,8-dihydropterin-6-yl-methyl-4-(beta-D-ribofuranosyl)aminobenzene 5'-phosphate synthase